MYFISNFYSHRAWQEWSANPQAEELPRHTMSNYGPREEFPSREEWLHAMTFDPVDRFSELVLRVAFLQLMNKRHVLYFRGAARDYGKDYGLPGHDLPSIFRTEGDYTLAELFPERWNHLLHQAEVWTRLLKKHSPRRRTIQHYPETVWALQQHYKDLLPEPKSNHAQSLLLDVSSSLRVAAAFAVGDGTPRKEHAFVTVVALPQTTGSISFCADDQLQLMRLSALCPPRALRPHIQEGFLVGRFPRPSYEEMVQLVDSGHYGSLQIEELFSLRRRIVARIPICVTEGFWEDGDSLAPGSLLSCPWFNSVCPNRRWEDDSLILDDDS